MHSKPALSKLNLANHKISTRYSGSSCADHTAFSKLVLYTFALFDHYLLLCEPPLHHATQDLKHDLGRRQRCLLPIPVKTRRDLNHIRSDQIQPINPSQNPHELPRRPPTGLRRPRARREARVNGIDINGQIDWMLRPYTLHDPVRNTQRAQLIDIIRRNPRPALRGIVLVVAIGEPAAQARMHGRPVRDEALFRGHPEHGSVIEEGLGGGLVRIEPGRGVLGGMPGVQVGVEVHDGDGPAVFGVQGTESGQGDAVVAAEGDEARGLEVRRGRGGRDGWRGAAAELQEGFAHLAEGESIVKGGDGDVAAVEDGGP